jgi:transcriptional regulator with GAF, ATPase, and Fis domain
MTDIVPNLLHLSSEISDVAELWEPALDLLCAALNCDAAAIVRANPPNWSVVAARGIARSQVPLELAAEAVERDEVVSNEGWLAGLISSASGARATVESGYVMVARSKCSPSQLGVALSRLSDAVAIVERQSRADSRIERLQAILAITHEWQQTNEMETLLVRMAEAATQLFDAERASIFLWDKPNHIIIGRPALGVEGNELRLPDDAGIVGQVIQTGEPRRVSSDQDTEVDRAVDRRTGYRTRTILCVPLVSPQGDRLGAFELLNKKDGVFSIDDQRGLTELASHAAVALQNVQQLSDLLDRHEKLVAQTAKDTLLVGESPAIQAVRATARRIADTDLAVLILGENGTGKEVVARAIHFGSRRRKDPFVAVNCAALTETLLESELFGHEKGAFTDAHESRAGKFELAAGGTLFLDEIGDMSLAGQAKMLRVLEDKTIVRVGGSRPIHTDVRVLAATNQKLVDLVRAKRFREDLYFRLNVVSIELPPLRQRGDDVLLLAEHFLHVFCQRAGRRVPKFTLPARKRLEAHSWPGNVRELRNLMERLAYLSTGDRIEAEELAFILAPLSGETPSLMVVGRELNDATQEFQRKYIQQTIDEARGNVTEAAKTLGVHRSNLYRKMRQLNMDAEKAAEL